MSSTESRCFASILASYWDSSWGGNDRELRELRWASMKFPGHDGNDNERFPFCLQLASEILIREDHWKALPLFLAFLREGGVFERTKWKGI